MEGHAKVRSGSRVITRLDDASALFHRLTDTTRGRGRFGSCRGIVRVRRASPCRRVGRTRRGADHREPEHLVLQCRRAARLPPARQPVAAIEQSHIQHGPRSCTWRRQQHQCHGMDTRHATGLRRVGEERSPRVGPSPTCFRSSRVRRTGRVAPMPGAAPAAQSTSVVQKILTPQRQPSSAQPARWACPFWMT